MADAVGNGVNTVQVDPSSAPIIPTPLTLTILPPVAIYNVMDCLSVPDVIHLESMTTRKLRDMMSEANDFWSHAIKHRLSILVPAKAYFDGPKHSQRPFQMRDRTGRETFGESATACDGVLQAALTAAGLILDVSIEHWVWEVKACGQWPKIEVDTHSTICDTKRHIDCFTERCRSTGLSIRCAL